MTIAPQPDGAATEVATANDSHVLWNTVGTELASDRTDAFAESLIGAVHGGGESRATGRRSNGIGAGSGPGAGSTSAAAGSGATLIQASYRDTPRPEYPDSARREGREGRVLLRVLIDDQGRTKAVEINTSSGSSILDRAAAEAIRRWSFHPARYGEQPVESWLRIPIEFRLADANSR
jgi:periplasmic protein TonB